jgi:hypothetical protein
MTATILSHPDPSRWRPGDVVVSRHVRLPFTTLVRRLTNRATCSRSLPLLGGEFSIAVSPLPATNGNCWRARGKLTPRRRWLVSFPPVEIEINPWSASASELRIIPLTRLAHLWGVRRMRMYTELANAAADSLISICSLSPAFQSQRRQFVPATTSRVIATQPGQRNCDR